jgi:para-aminobenzoate synthetase component I
MSLSDFATEMNRLGRDKVPFLFLVDFEMEKPLLIRLTDVTREKMIFDVNGIRNHDGRFNAEGTAIIEKKPESWTSYKKKFDNVFRRLEYGDSFLTNLTISTEIVINRTLRDIFIQSSAKYKLLVEDEFLVFSPETFIQIKDGKIFSFPMKGTIDAAIPRAEERILSDRKETSEHVTIVDLIRNDISQIATDVQVTRFRYIDKIRTSSKTLLQVSSEIVGQLENGYLGQLGNILVKLLPGGSVSGAPKSRTLEIIRQTEVEKRGYYTGVFGIFDGESLDSGVMIRFIEKQGAKYFYRSGGGITTQSKGESEYQEAIDKVYVPIN